MTAGAVVPPTVIPLRLPIPGKPKHMVDTHTPIELRSETPHTEIFYTVDGSKPNPFPWVGCDWRTRRYHHPIFLDEGRKIIKALAVDTTKNRESFVITKTFFVTKAPNTDSMGNLEPIGRCTFKHKIKNEIGEIGGEMHDANEGIVLEEESSDVMRHSDSKDDDGIMGGENDVETAIENENVAEEVDDVEDVFSEAGVHFTQDDEDQDEILFDIEEGVDNLENMIGEAIAEKVAEVTFGGRHEVQSNMDVGSRCRNCQAALHPSPLSHFCADCGEGLQQDSQFLVPNTNQMGVCVDCRCVVPMNLPFCVICEVPFSSTSAVVKMKERKVCKSCCTLNSVEADLCIMCGKTLSIVVQKSNPHLPKTAPTIHTQCNVITSREFSKCEECGRTNSREGRFCDWCGEKLLSSVDLIIECRHCRTENGCLARYCQECGSPLHAPCNEAIMSKLQKQQVDKAVMVFCSTKDQFTQTLDLWKNPDVQSQGVQTCGYYLPGQRGKKRVNKLQNVDMADVRILTPRTVSPGRGFWRQQVDHITKHLKVHAYNDAQFRKNIGQLKLKDLKATTVQEKENDINVVLTFALGREDDYGGVGAGGQNALGMRVSHIAPAFTQDVTNIAITDHKSLNSQNAPKQQPRKKSLKKKQVTNEEVLLLAIQKKEDVNVVKSVLSKGVNLARCTRNGCSVLSWAVQCCHPDAIPLLMQYGAGNTALSEAQPPLHAAVLLQEAGQPAVEALLRYGADPGVTNRNGQTAYEVATIVDNEFAAKLFSMHLGKVMLSDLITSNLK